MKCNSRIDAYYWLMVSVAIIILALPNFVFNFSWVYFAIMLLVDIIILGLILSTRYELTEDELVIKSAFIKFGIKYDRITSIEKIKSLSVSSSATARRCVRIRFGVMEHGNFNSVNISPEHEEAFLKLLLANCAELTEIKEHEDEKIEG